MKEFPVETNPYRLVEYCCGSNIYKEGEDVKLKPESEYPDWLWTLNTGKRLSIKLNSVIQILLSLISFIIYGRYFKEVCSQPVSYSIMVTVLKTLKVKKLIEVHMSIL